MPQDIQGTNQVWLVMTKATRAPDKGGAADIEETGISLSDFEVLEVLLPKGLCP